MWMTNEALQLRPTLQRDWILQQLDSTDEKSIQAAIGLATNHCERYRSGPTVFVPALVGLLPSTKGQLRNQILYALSGLGGLGLAELERLASQTHDDEAAKALDGFRKNWESFLIKPLVALPASACEMSDPLATAEQFLGAAKLPLRLKALSDYLDISGDSERTVELIAATWRADFVALPLLELLGKCGIAATRLVPELKAMIGAETRCVSAGWLHGICSLDEAIIKAAQSALLQLA
jgi:hypothetical protein